MQSIIIRRETETDHRTVEALVRAAFWNVYRPGCLEHYVLHTFRIRPDFVPQLDLVLEEGGRIIGHVMFVRSFVRCDDGRKIPVLTGGPLSIAPDRQRRGFGSRLLAAAMARARELGEGAVVLTGDSGFYGRLGFLPGKSRGIRFQEDPDADYFLAAELEPGFLDSVAGTYRDPDGYFVEEGDVEVFDRQFPPKEKKTLPGQLF